MTLKLTNFNISFFFVLGDTQIENLGPCCGSISMST